MPPRPRGAQPVALRPVSVADAATLHRLYAENRSFFEPWFPARDESAYTEAALRAELAAQSQEHRERTGYHFTITAAGGVVGRLDLNHVARGFWQNTILGYWIAEPECGKGYATSAVVQAIDFAFTQAQLHRVEAAVMPRNGASLRVLAKAGLRGEGLAHRYLNINRRWEDHARFAITREEWDAAETD